jgi:hypothetical protein
MTLDDKGLYSFILLTEIDFASRNSLKSFGVMRVCFDSYRPRADTTNLSHKQKAHPSTGQVEGWAICWDDVLITY